jgi:hypothetical protein
MHSVLDIMNIDNYPLRQKTYSILALKLLSLYLEARNHLQVLKISVAVPTLTSVNVYSNCIKVDVISITS